MNTVTRKMCYINQSICAGCKTITETPTPMTPCLHIPDVLHPCCVGTKCIVNIEYTKPEFCLTCYNKELVSIQKKWEKKEAVHTSKAKIQGYSSAKIGSMRRALKRDMSNEIAKLNQEWEKMWSI